MSSLKVLSRMAPLAVLGACASTRSPPAESPGARSQAPVAAVSKPDAAGGPIEQAQSRPANSRGRVLFLGDSFSVGAFGRTFDQSLRDAGFEVYTSVSGGGTPYYWLSEYPPVSIGIAFWERTPATQRRLGSIPAVPKLEALMAKWDPDIVVVQTGTNLYATLRSKRRPKEANVKEVETLTSKMCRAITSGGARCYWITPPAAGTETYPKALQDEMLQITRRAVRPYGRVFDSYAVTEFPADPSNSDGIHLGPAQARAWARSAVSDFLATH